MDSSLVKKIVLFIAMSLSYATGFYVMVHGWGIQPANLSIIIGGYAVSAIVSLIVASVRT